MFRLNFCISVFVAVSRADFNTSNVSVERSCPKIKRDGRGYFNTSNVSVEPSKCFSKIKGLYDFNTSNVSVEHLENANC